MAVSNMRHFNLSLETENFKISDNIGINFLGPFYIKKSLTTLY